MKFQAVIALYLNDDRVSDEVSEENLRSAISVVDEALSSGIQDNMKLALVPWCEVHQDYCDDNAVMMSVRELRDASTAIN